LRGIAINQFTQELWDRCLALRASRRVVPKTGQKATRVHLLQSLAVCAHCGRRLGGQTPNNYPTYYREDSHLRGYHDCPYSGQSIHADRLDGQIATLIQSLKLTPTWEDDVRKLLDDEQDRTDPETERKEMRSMWRLMRDNYEILFRLMDGLRTDARRRYWIREQGAEGNIVDIGEEIGQIATEVKIAFPMSHNVLTIVEEYVHGRSNA
jgi:hypothetical protein